MTLIYACATDDLVFLLADTFTEIPLTARKFNWFTEPLAKIIRVNDDCLVAFAGSSAAASESIRRCRALGLVDIQELLLQSHTDNLGTDSAVDYVVCDVHSRSLQFIKNGKCENRAVGYIGSKDGFEVFQKHRLSGEINSDGASLKGIRIPDGVSVNTRSVFCSCVSAFVATLNDASGGCGGFMVPYVVSAKEEKFSSYILIFRGPIEESETPLISGWHDIAFNDPRAGGFLITFWGSKDSFAAYFPNGACGVTYSGTAELIFECQFHKQIDGYDFSDLADSRGCGSHGVSTWSNWKNHISKANQYLLDGRTDKAVQLVSEVGTMIAKDMVRLNPAAHFDFSRRVIENFTQEAPVGISFETLNMISAYLEVNVYLYHSVKQFDCRDMWRREFITWNGFISSLKFEIRPGEVVVADPNNPQMKLQFGSER